MKVLVTGGLGFIGASVAEHYVEQGHKVTILDDKSSNVVDDVAGAKVVVGPINYHYFSFDETDLIVHCASPVGPAGILSKSGRIASAIVSDTQRVVDWCQRRGAYLINISTSEVYGFSGVYHETDDLRCPANLSPRIEYAVGKLAAEATVRLTPGLKAITIRPFNVAGARQSKDGGFVLPTFAEQALRGEKLTVFEDGHQERCLTAVDDVARFITGLEEHYFDGRVVNVGNPHNRASIRNLAALVNAAAGRRAQNMRYTTGKKVHGPTYAEAEGKIKVPDITLAISMGWTPEIGIADLVDQAITHAKASLQAYEEVA